MARSIYVMPIAGAGIKEDPRRPKYQNSTFSTLDWSMFDYGNEPWCMVGIQDVPVATDNALNAQSDVFELPSNLDQTIGTIGARNTVRSRLEAVNIPGTWVQTSTTYQEVVRFIGAACQFAQRFQGIMNDGSVWFSGGITLDSTFNSLPATARNGIQSAAASFGFDTSSFSGASTLRQIIQSAGEQYLALGFPLDLEGPL